MQALGSSTRDVGQRVAAALVGTFFGILISYGVVGPLSNRMEALTEYFQMMRVAIAAFFRGASPMLAAELGRRSMPLDLRPTLEEMESELGDEYVPRLLFLKT
jgi:chemotaxis protein MotA